MSRTPLSQNVSIADAARMKNSFLTAKTHNNWIANILRGNQVVATVNVLDELKMVNSFRFESSDLKELSSITGVKALRFAFGVHNAEDHDKVNGDEPYLTLVVEALDEAGVVKGTKDYSTPCPPYC